MLAKCLDLRSLGEYEGGLDGDERIVTDLINACQAVPAKVEGLAALA